MKLNTHISVGVGVASLLPSLVGCEMLCFALSIVLGGAVHGIVDQLSHEWRGGTIRRGPLLHSVEGSLALSLLLTALLAVLPIPLSLLSWVVVFFSTWASLLSHLLLDSLTPAGVYFGGRNVSLASFRYDSPELNGFFSLLGLALFLFSLLNYLKYLPAGP
ncbi:MAG: DUF1286 domain-containing protein [Acidilobaceae archaeon]|nr:DUF1286 domain-containing protein [Acidilobaceae archaeon]MCX8165107.1 DUF1286 domain-containing protein [Acidilobaceae archaeon]MDW7974377.1 DUF1286 domain-containing protein [Sulfolobales archaeon]